MDRRPWLAREIAQRARLIDAGEERAFNGSERVFVRQQVDSNDMSYEGSDLALACGDTINVEETLDVFVDPDGGTACAACLTRYVRAGRASFDIEDVLYAAEIADAELQKPVLEEELSMLRRRRSSDQKEALQALQEEVGGTLASELEGLL